MPLQAEASSTDHPQARRRPVSPRPPAREGRGQHEVVVVGLAPVLVGVVGHAEVYLPAEVQEFLAEGRPEREPLRDLELAGVKRDLQGGDGAALGDALGVPCSLPRQVTPVLPEPGNQGAADGLDLRAIFLGSRRVVRLLFHRQLVYARGGRTPG